MSKKLTTKEFINKSKKIHGNKYNYSKVKYKNCKTKVIIICSKHGKFEQIPGNHMKGCGCPKCKNIKLRQKFSFTHKKFITKAKKIHNDVYDYSLILYKNAQTKIKIVCPIHGVFLQTPKEHLKGSRCKYCFGSKRLATKEFIRRAELTHGNRFDYSKVLYKSSQKKIKIICDKHGVFYQTPNDHLSGNGCSKCSNKKQLTTKEFVKKAKKIHRSKYNYFNVNYVNSHTKVIIICSNHGQFKQTPNNHLNGNGCYKCNNSVSKKSQKWLDKIEKELGYKLEREYFINIGRYIIDGFDPKTNTCYEYHGDYWHGNPKIYDPLKLNKKAKKTFGELFSETQNKETLIKNAGYNLVVEWENDEYKLNRRKV